MILKDQTIFIVFNKSQTLVFNEPKQYQRYLNDKPVSYRRTFIGGGPRGNTIVYVLNQSDREKKKNTAKSILEGDLKIIGKFYGEVYYPNKKQLYVFTRFASFKKYIETGKKNDYLFENKTGVNQKTVFYVLENANQHQPSAQTIKTFKRVHGINH